MPGLGWAVTTTNKRALDETVGETEGPQTAYGTDHRVEDGARWLSPRRRYAGAPVSSRPSPRGM